MPKIGIVIPILNQFQLAIEAIESVKTQYEYRIYPILNYRDRLPLAGAWNLGIGKAFDDGCSHALVINDDILFAPGTIDETLGLIREDVVLATPMNARGQMEPYDIYTYHNLSSTIDIAESPDFACFMLTSDTIDRIGWFDENFVPAYFEDNDYHRRINLAEYRAVTSGNIKYYHYGSRTQNHNNDPVVRPELFEQNRFYYTTKWGGPPGSECFELPFNDINKTIKDW